MDAETLYLKLADFVRSETGCEISDEADETLADAARLIADAENGTDRAVDPNRRYAMFSTAGNAAAEAETTALVGRIIREEFPRRDLHAQVETLLARVSATHGEVYDTEPRAQVRHEVSQACESVGWKGVDY